MPYASVSDVAAVLRLTAGDVDDARIAAALDVTARLIDEALAPGPFTPPVVDPLTRRRVVERIYDPAELELLRQANLRAAIDWYEAQRAPGGYVDVGDPLGVPGRLSVDPLAGVNGLLDAVGRRPGGFA